jgi:hypothetical protein
MIRGEAPHRSLRREAVELAAAFVGVTLGVTVLRRAGGANWDCLSRHESRGAPRR